MQRVTGIALFVLAAARLAAGEGQAGVNPLQALIDAAAPGAVISVPAGTYRGGLTLKEGVALAGAGADATVIDGNGADTVISGANNAMVIGCTLRNGRVAVSSPAVSMGVFECRIGDFRSAGIQVIQGCAVIANNLIEGHSKSTGVYCYQSNPYLLNNVIASNAIGARIAERSFPNLERNVFVANGTGVVIEADSYAYLATNIFDRNGDAIRGQAFGATDALQPVTLDGQVPLRGGTPEAYRALMNAVLSEKLKEHPLVIYDLREELGRFGMTILFPYATFTVAASARDTHIAAYGAFDAATARDLNAQLLPPSPLPAVAVVNPDIRDVTAQRYVLDCAYEHAASYAAGTNGQRVFKRETNVTRAQVVLPAGFAALTVNYPAAIATRPDGNQVVSITQVGTKRIEILMAPAAR